jgi:hypothetical protein
MSVLTELGLSSPADRSLSRDVLRKERESEGLIRRGEEVASGLSKGKPIVGSVVFDSNRHDEGRRPKR